MALNIKKPHELAEYNYLRAAFYGGPGVGKSTLAVSAPAPLYIDCDKGVHRMDAKHHCDTIEVDQWEDITAILDGDISDYKTLIIDTAGKMMLYMNEYLIRKNGKNGQSDGSLTQKAYGVRKSMFIDFVNRISKLKKHLIFVCHDREGKKGENTLYMRPDIGGSSGDDLIRELDLVGYIFMSQEQRMITFDPAENYFGKNTMELPRYQPLPNSITGPNKFMTNIITSFEAQAEARSLVKKKYRDIIVLMEQDVDAVKDVVSANEIYEKMNTYEAVWDSIAVGKKMVAGKALNIGLKINVQERRFEVPPAPPKADPPASEPAKDNAGKDKSKEKEKDKDKDKSKDKQPEVI